jgi:hypothetical protein
VTAKNPDLAVRPPQIGWKLRDPWGPVMRHYARPLRATLTTLVMLVAMAGAAVAGPLGDFYHPDCQAIQEAANNFISDALVAS